MIAQKLIESEAELWRAATHHPFLDGVRDGTLPAEDFARWLVQDYQFGAALTRVEARYLAGAPREDLALLAAGVQAMVAELDWFEQKAAERELHLGAPSASCISARRSTQRLGPTLTISTRSATGPIRSSSRHSGRSSALTSTPGAGRDRALKRFGSS